MSSSTEEETPNVKRERSPSFPYLDLDTSVEHLRMLYAVAKMNEVRLKDVSDAWNMTPLSGSFARYLSALKQYHLIETSGSGMQRRVKISNEGRRILEDDRPGARETFLSKAALNPKLIRGLFFGEEGMPEWGTDRPADSIATSALKFDLSFGEDAAKRFLAVYDETIKHIEGANEAATESDEPAADKVEVDEFVTPPPEPDVAKPVMAPPETVTQHAKRKNEANFPEVETELNEIMFRSNPGGTVTLSATLDANGLDILEKKIAGLRMLLS